MKRIVTLLALLLAAPLRADDAPLRPWEGVWQGTVGTLPVRMCLQQSSDTWSVGVYYYLSQLKTIRLERQDDGGWIEAAGKGGAQSGRWTFAPAGNAMGGEWRQGARVLPVSLQRVAADISEGACRTREFLAPRIAAPKIKETPRNLGPFAYRALDWDVGKGFPEVSLSSFAFTPSQPGDKAINAALRLDPGKPEGDADYVGCFQGSIGSLGNDGDFSFGYAPHAVTRRYLTVAGNNGGFCGGAHPFAESWWITFDRRTGRKVDLGTWFTPAGIPRGESYFPDAAVRPLSADLRRAVVRHMRFEESECRDAVSETEFWFIGLERTGLVFSPSLPHVIMACTDDARVPFADLTRWLSPAGKAGAARQKAG